MSTYHEWIEAKSSIPPRVPKRYDAAAQEREDEA